MTLLSIQRLIFIFSQTTPTFLFFLTQCLWFISPQRWRIINLQKIPMFHFSLDNCCFLIFLKMTINSSIFLYLDLSTCFSSKFLHYLYTCMVLSNNLFWTHKYVCSKNNYKIMRLLIVAGVGWDCDRKSD